MKHRILIEFSADTLPDDFLDQIAGRVYGHPAVDKKECTAAFVGDVLKDAQSLQNLRRLFNYGRMTPAIAGYKIIEISPMYGNEQQVSIDYVINAAKDTQ